MYPELEEHGEGPEPEGITTSDGQLVRRHGPAGWGGRQFGLHMKNNRRPGGPGRAELWKLRDAG